jgi:hypothetical protein
MPSGPWFRPALSGDLSQGSSALGVNQLSRVICARVLGPT